MHQPGDARQAALEGGRRHGRARAGRAVEVQVGATPSLPAGEQLPRGLRHALEGRPLALHHVLVELGWAADGLAGVVDDEVEAVVGGEELVTEGLDARRVAEVEAVDLEPVFPAAEVRLPGVAGRRVAGKAGRDDQTGAGAER